MDDDLIPKAPKITEQPEDVVYEVTSSSESAMLECQADGYPNPAYQWFKVRVNQKTPINPKDDGR